MEPVPSVYALSVIVPAEPLVPSRADQVRCSVRALAGAAVLPNSTVIVIARSATPRRPLIRTCLPPFVPDPGGTFVPVGDGSHTEGVVTRDAFRNPVSYGTERPGTRPRRRVATIRAEPPSPWSC